MSVRSIVVLASEATSLLSFRGELLRSMVARGHTVTAVAPDTTPEIVRSLAELGVGWRAVRLNRRAIDPWGDFLTLAALVRLFRELRPDLLVPYTIKPVIWGSLAARLAGVPQVCSLITGLGTTFGVGGGLRQRLVGAAARWLYWAALRRNACVLFQNPDDLALFRALRLLPGTCPAVVVNGSGVDLTLYRPAPPVGEPVFFMAARLIAAKGVADYVAAGRLLRRRFLQVRLRLAGTIDHGLDAVDPAELAAWVENGEVEHLGWLDDVRPALAAAAVYVLPSYYREGIPRSVLEAIAMARPIVTTDTPGCRETVVNGVNGYLVPPRDPPALATALARFIEEPSLIATMGAASRRLAETKFDVHTVNRVILAALEL